jgi:hypothetical protein
MTRCGVGGCAFSAVARECTELAGLKSALMLPASDDGARMLPPDGSTTWSATEFCRCSGCLRACRPRRLPKAVPDTRELSVPFPPGPTLTACAPARAAPGDDVREDWWTLITEPACVRVVRTDMRLPPDECAECREIMECGREWRSGRLLCGSACRVGAKYGMCELDACDMRE